MNISPSFGTILGGNALILTGESFGATAGTVTIEGRTCEVTSWTDSEVRATTPPRITNGRRVATAETVSVVVTRANLTTASVPFAYKVSVLTLALNAIREKIATISPVTDPHYNYTITPGQILNYHRDVSENTGAAYPQCLVFATDTDYSAGQDEPYGFYTGRTPCVVTATTILSEACNWDEETRALMADLCRAIQLTRLTDAHALSFDITKATPGQETDPELGSLGSVVVEFDIVWKHIATNWNSVTEGE